MKLTWTDIEAHQAAATPAQWRRMQAYFRDGKPIGRIAREDGVLIDETPRQRNSAILCLGRGCIAVLNSMLERPVREIPPSVLAQPAQALNRALEPIPERPRRRRRNDRGWILAQPKGALPKNSTSDAPAPEPTQAAQDEGGLSVPAQNSASEESSGPHPAPEGALALALQAALTERTKSG